MVVLHAFLLLVNLASDVLQKPLLYVFCIDVSFIHHNSVLFNGRSSDNDRLSIIKSVLTTYNIQSACGYERKYIKLSRIGHSI